MRVGKNFVPDKKWFKEEIYRKTNFDFDSQKDFVVIPEIWAHFAEDLEFYKKKINYGIFVQGFYHMNSINEFSKLKKSYENASLILTDSVYSIKYLKEMFPKQKNKIIRINF